MDGCCDAVRKHPPKLGNAPGIYHVPFAKYISGALVFLSCCGVGVWFMLSSCLELRRAEIEKWKPVCFHRNGRRWVELTHLGMMCCKRAEKVELQIYMNNHEYIRYTAKTAK